jgi:HTH-type transcriptional regulator/antitoxin HigA
MDKRGTNDYLPDYAVSPGDVLADELALLGMSQQELADLTGMSLTAIVAISEAKVAITPEAALKLERALGLSAEIWCNIETQYQETLARVNDVERLG